MTETGNDQYAGGFDRWLRIINAILTSCVFIASVVLGVIALYYGHWPLLLITLLGWLYVALDPDIGKWKHVWDREQSLGFGTLLIAVGSITLLLGGVIILLSPASAAWVGDDDECVTEIQYSNGTSETVDTLEYDYSCDVGTSDPPESRSESLEIHHQNRENAGYAITAGVLGLLASTVVLSRINRGEDR